jgi:glutamate formiminotransferase/formiminotetrahydrofolate cyclodeaminase
MAFETETLQNFLDVLASDAPAPGGGSVAAVCGALGAALVSMVSNLTVGKEKYRDNWTRLEDVRSRSEAMRAEFVKLMNDDTESFNDFMAAMKMPKDTDAQKESRWLAMESASKGATEVPLATLELCAEMAGIALLAAQLGNRNAASDAGSAALLAEAAGKAAAYNVRINLPGIKDGAFVEAVRGRMNAALASLEEKCGETASLMDEIF